MEKIPTAPYRTYLNKYKIKSYEELVAAKPELEKKVRDAENEHYEIQKVDAGQLEYEAWIKLRNLKAELGVLTHITWSKWIEKCNEEA